MKQVSKQILFVLLFILIISILANVLVYFSGRNAVTGKSFSDSGQVSIVKNRPPYLVKPIPNYTWPRFTSTNGPNLNEYFEDPDNDSLVYFHTTLEFINVSYLSGWSTILTPRDVWWGVEKVKWFAVDPFNQYAESNIVYLNVTFVELVVQDVSESGDSQGSNNRVQYLCIENWKCTQWSECIGGKQVRSCIDVNYCMTNNTMPEVLRDCVTPDCYDGVKNCHHNLCEEDIDCGGPCSPCPSCYDGEQNCHDGYCEEDIDCGGPCLPCGISNIKEFAFINAPWFALLFLLMSVFIVEVYLFYLVNKHKKNSRK